MANAQARLTEEPGEIIAWFHAGQQVEVLAQAVYDDEPCLYLGEFNFPAKNSKSFVRYQKLVVIRDDRPVTAWVHLGQRKAYKADEFQIPGGEVFPDGRGKVWHTVGELREIADELRAAKLRREQEPMDLQTAFRKYSEERLRRQRHISTFGAGVHLQRD